MIKQNYILVLYYSSTGNTELMAKEIANGVNSIHGQSALIRTVPSINKQIANIDSIPETGPQYCQIDDLRNCSGLILGSPTRFGNMSAPLKHFIDSTSDIWMSGSLIDKPAGVFTSTSSMHGGNESTLLSMMIPLLHHGMLPVGLPYSHKSLHLTEKGGTPYGPSNVSSGKSSAYINEDEILLCRELGKRVAKIALKLKQDK